MRGEYDMERNENSTRPRLLIGDVLDQLRILDNGIIQTCVTSPPYWNLRDYGVEGQIGLEPTPEEYIERMVVIFNEVRRVLRSEGTLWLNMGDCYAANTGFGLDTNQDGGKRKATTAFKTNVIHPIKPKNLMGMPWRLALALQAAGWWLRSDIIWSKPNPMPESVSDRPTKAHEYICLLTKSSRYYYDPEAIKRPVTGNAHSRGNGLHPKLAPAGSGIKANESWSAATNKLVSSRNARTVWTIPTQPYPEAHFATFPEAIPERCIKAGSRRGEMVLDPFAGSGTTLAVASRLGRSSIGIELNPEFAALARKRCHIDSQSLESFEHPVGVSA